MKVKVKRVKLQSLAQTVLSALEDQDYLTSDARYGEVNRGYALLTIYEVLLEDFEPED